MVLEKTSFTASAEKKKLAIIKIWYPPQVYFVRDAH